MTLRNLTEVFVLMRNNAHHNRNICRESYDDSEEGEKLLPRSPRSMEEGLEMRGDYAPPSWLDKLEEAQYSLSKIRPKLDELTSLQARHLLKPSLNESSEEEQMIEALSGEISKLISSTHRHIQCIRSSLNVGHKKEQLLTQNVIVYLLNELQDVTQRFRNSQNNYLKEFNNREARSNAFFDQQSFSDIDLGKDAGEGWSGGSRSQVDSFDNFLNPKSTLNSALQDDDDQIDEYFQKPVAGRLLSDQQLLLFEEENTRLIESREREVSKIVKSIMDLHDIFKDLAGMVHEQGTVLDRIDYNVECTQSKVADGLKQLQKAESYQKKNRKMCIILVEAGLVLFLLLVLIVKMS